MHLNIKSLLPKPGLHQDLGNADESGHSGSLGTFWTLILILRVVMCPELTDRIEVVEWPFLLKIVSLCLY
jgi:hypothetical protein